jgi:hypothetical protein
MRITVLAISFRGIRRELCAISGFMTPGMHMRSPRIIAA